MKNNQQQINEKKAFNAQCPQGNPVTFLCSSKHCKSQAFICNDQACPCQASHQICPQIPIQKLSNALLANCHSFEHFQSSIQKFFEKSIDQISQLRDKVLAQISQNYQYFGLNQNEKKLVKKLHNGCNNEGIDGQYVWNIQSGLRQSINVQKIKDSFEQQMTIIDKHANQTLNEMAKGFLEFQKIIESKVQQAVSEHDFQLKISRLSLHKESKIVKTIEDQKKLFNFFKNKVKSTKLLYRASQNQFLVSKFHEKCDHIPNTLTICETEHGKIIGGFTNFSWYKPNGSSIYVPAPNSQSEHFTFSLTNNDKFEIVSYPHIYALKLNADDSYGPSWSGGDSLRIADKANVSKKTYAGVNNDYINKKYTYGDTASYQRFSGSNNNECLLKEWEVWHVQFIQ